jgi:hypothetical protein
MSGLAKYTFGRNGGLGRSSGFGVPISEASNALVLLAGLQENWQAHAAAAGFATLGHPYAAITAEVAALLWNLYILSFFPAGEIGTVKTTMLLVPPALLGAAFGTLGWYMEKRKK